MHLDPDYPRFWIVVTSQEKIGPFYAEEAAKVWVKDRSLEAARIETVTFTSKWDQERSGQ